MVGNDDSEIAALPYVDLTTVAQDTRRLAAEATRLARSRMQDPRKLGGVVGSATGEAGGAKESEGAGVLVPVELVVRSSTGPVAERD